MTTNKTYYTVSAVVGEYRHYEYHILASSEKQARFFYSAPYSKGGRGNGFRIYDVEVTPEPGYEKPMSDYEQMVLNFFDEKSAYSE